MKVLWLIDSNAEQTLEGEAPEGWLFKYVASMTEALFALQEEREKFNVCLVSLPIEDEEPPAILDQLLRADPRILVIFARDNGAAAEAVQLLRLGAFYYLDSTPSLGTLKTLLGQISINSKSGRADQGGRWRQSLVGQSPAMQQLADMVSLIAPRRSTVLILGETGSGKEVVARAIHLASPRADKPFVPVNCAAIPDELLEAELFGHVKGAFTGATNARVGRFEQAHRGTLFLDEIGDMPLDLQTKLLRVLQEREFNRVGSSDLIQADVRLIAATNADLLERVKQGKFREDLYYRLNVVPIRVPSLRERAEDIPVLVQHFIRKICAQEHIPLKSVSLETLDRLAQSSWPGNVRQLENAVEMAVVLSGERTTLLSSDFPIASQGVRRPVSLQQDNFIQLPEHGLDFEHVIGKIELNLLEQALQRAKGNKKVAADILGLKRTTLAAKLKSLESLVSR